MKIQENKIQEHTGTSFSIVKVDDISILKFSDECKINNTEDYATIVLGDCTNCEKIKFIDKFPGIDSLAMASELEVLHTWQGLGYYSRALNMLNAAKTIKNNFSGIFPSSYNELITLKGVGIYTASAISSICQNEKRAVVDGNVYRVLTRLYNIQIPINTHIGKIKIQNIHYFPL